jgi:hypothetical protein
MLSEIKKDIEDDIFIVKHKYINKDKNIIFPNLIKIYKEDYNHLYDYLKKTNTNLHYDFGSKTFRVYYEVNEFGIKRLKNITLIRFFAIENKMTSILNKDKVKAKNGDIYDVRKENILVIPTKSKCTRNDEFSGLKCYMELSALFNDPEKFRIDLDNKVGLVLELMEKKKDSRLVLFLKEAAYTVVVVKALERLGYKVELVRIVDDPTNELEIKSNYGEGDIVISTIFARFEINGKADNKCGSQVKIKQALDPNIKFEYYLFYLPNNHRMFISIFDKNDIKDCVNAYCSGYYKGEKINKSFLNYTLLCKNKDLLHFMMTESYHPDGRLMKDVALVNKPLFAKDHPDILKISNIVLDYFPQNYQND